MAGLLISALRVPLRLPGAMMLVFLAAALTQLLAVLPIVAIALVGAEAQFLSTLGDRSGAGRNPRAASAVLIRLVILFPLAVPLLGMWFLLLPAALAEPLGLSGALGLAAFVLLLQFAGAAAALWRLGKSRSDGRLAPAATAALAGWLPWAAHFLWGGEALPPHVSTALAFGVSETLALAVIGAAAFPEPRASVAAGGGWIGDILAYLGESFALVRQAPLALAVILAATPADPFAFFFFSWSIAPDASRSLAERLPESAASAMACAAGLVMVAALAHLLARVGGRMWPRPLLMAPVLMIVFGALALRVVGWYLMTVAAMVLAFAAGWSAAQGAVPANQFLYPFLLALGGAGANLVALAVLLVARPVLARAVEGTVPAQAPGRAAGALAVLGAARVAALFAAFGLGEASAAALMAGLALFGLIELVTLAALARAALSPGTAFAPFHG